MAVDEYRSFLVRIWCVPSKQAGDYHRCYELEQIQNGVRRRFQSMGELLAFLQQAAGVPGPEEPCQTQNRCTMQEFT